MLNMLNSITLEQLSMDKHLRVYSLKDTPCNHVHTIKSKFASLDMFAQYLLLKPYTML